MDTHDIILLTISSVILLEVSYLLLRLPRTSLRSREHPVLIDTSVLMDGRIIPIAAAGFLQGKVVIPRTVVGELQFLADNADAEKRARARRGLDVITELQHMPGISVELLQDGSKAREGVDERLLMLAKRHRAAICTVDYNLNKVAVVEGVTVLNINELAQSLRMAHLPGEQMLLELVQKGQEQHQAVGYLPDGTMVVVEHASGKIGQMVQVEVVRSLQTAAGKMMFARQVDAKPAQPIKTKKPAVQVAEKQKSNGRRQVPRSQEASAKKQEAKLIPESPSKETQPRRNANNRRKRIDHEATLLDLVDKQ
jgi:rRNA-processing protein FCF1